MKRLVSAGIVSAGLLMLGMGQVSAAPVQAGKPAKIHVLLPANAALTIDGRPTKSTSTDRLFITPPLASGKIFHYDLTANFVRDGKNVSVQQSVAVRAGQQTNVSFDLFGSRQAFDAESFHEAAFSSSDFLTPGLRGYYVPSGRLVAGYRLSGIPMSARGFQPIRWGSGPSDPFYPGGHW